MRQVLAQRLWRSASCSLRNIHCIAAASTSIKVGDKLPPVEVHEGDPHCLVNIAEVFQGKKGILFGVPGAYTPACNKSHLPSYVENYEALKKGVEIIVCIAVNDAFVMSAWGSAQKVAGKVRMFTDPTGTFTRAVGLELDKEPLITALGNKRCKRFVLVLDNGVVKELKVEEDGTGLSCSLASHAMKLV